MVATLHIYIPLHCYYSAPIDPTLVHITQTFSLWLKKKQLQSNGHKYEKIYMHAHITFVQNLKFLHQNLWHVVHFTDQCY